ncbi:MAG: hypothetical protein ACP5NS_01660 [Candidatus Pacearchaeota archaeon]
MTLNYLISAVVLGFSPYSPSFPESPVPETPERREYVLPVDNEERKRRELFEGLNMQRYGPPSRKGGRKHADVGRNDIRFIRPGFTK